MELDCESPPPPPPTLLSATLSESEMEHIQQFQPFGITYLFRVHAETMLGIEKREHYREGYFMSNPVKTYEKQLLERYDHTIPEKQFIVRYVNSIRNLVKDNHEENNYYKVPIYVGAYNIYKYDSLNHQFFDKIMKGEEHLQEVLREQPLLNNFNSLFNLLSQFINQYYYSIDNSGIKATRTTTTTILSSQFINLITNIIRIFGFEPIINDYMRDCNGNILMNQKYSLLCPELNIVVTICSDLSPESEIEWRNALLSSQIMQRTNKFGYNSNSILFTINSNSNSTIVSYFVTSKRTSLDSPTDFAVDFVNRFNIELRENLFNVIGVLWMYLLYCFEEYPNEEQLVPNPFIGILSNHDIDTIQKYLKRYNFEHRPRPKITTEQPQSEICDKHLLRIRQMLQKHGMICKPRKTTTRKKDISDELIDAVKRIGL